MKSEIFTSKMAASRPSWKQFRSDSNLTVTYPQYSNEPSLKAIRKQEAPKGFDAGLIGSVYKVVVL